MATEKTAEEEEKETEKGEEAGETDSIKKEEGTTSAMGALDSLEVSDDDFVWAVCEKQGKVNWAES